MFVGGQALYRSSETAFVSGQGSGRRGFANKAIAKAFHAGSQALQAGLLIAPLVGLCSFVEIRFPPAQQALDVLRRLSRRRKNRHVRSDAPRDLAVVGAQGGLGVSRR